MAEHKKHLYYMNELSDYKISDGFPDIRGWDVKDFDNRVIGKVDNLMANPEAGRVVYLDVEVDKSIIDAKHDPYGRPNNTEVREFVNKDGENHIIVPIGLVDLNTDSNYVYTDVIDHQTFAETKRYRKGDNLNRSYEVQVMDSYSRKTRKEDWGDRNDSRYEDIKITHDSDDHDDIPNESRIREIVREEIREFHEQYDSENLKTRQYSTGRDDSFLTDEEREIERRRRNHDVDDDDRFYERREFDDERFRNKRTPGL